MGLTPPCFSAINDPDMSKAGMVLTSLEFKTRVVSYNF